MKVKLKKIVGTLDAMKDQQTAYLHKVTGEVLTFDESVLESAKNGAQEGEGAGSEAVKRAADVLKDAETFARLPLKGDIHEYRLMSTFADSITNKSVASMVKLSITGKGAFRRFKDVLRRYGMTEQWNEYKEPAIAKVARRWCERNGIEYE